MKDLREIITLTIVENSMIDIDNTGQERYTLNEEQFGLLTDNLVKNIEVIHCCKSDSEQLKDLKEPTLEEWLKDNFIPLGNNGFTNRNEDTVWTKSELAEIHATLHL